MPVNSHPCLPQRAQEIAAALSQDRGNRAGVGGKLQFAAARIGNVNPRRKGSWQVPANENRQRLFAAAPRFPFGKRRVSGNDAFEGCHPAH